jgi:anti-sigma factor RsiW
MPTKPPSRTFRSHHNSKDEMRPTHITGERLEEYSMGRLLPGDVDHVEEHLLMCDRCRNRLVEVEETIYLIREALRPSPDDGRGAPCSRSEKK